MDNAVETTEYNGRDIKIYYEENPESPREWDNLCEFHSLNGRYLLGDTEHQHSREELQKVERVAKRQGDMVSPYYAYIHGGVTISLGSFYGRVPQGHAHFDSGQCGVVIIRRKKILEEFTDAGRRMTKALREKAMKHAESEIKAYDQYLRGEIYGFIIIENGEHKDSCWGYYGIEDAISAAKEDCDAEDKMMALYKKEQMEKQQPLLFATN